MKNWEEIQSLINSSDKSIRVLPFENPALIQLDENFELVAGSTLEALVKNCGGIVIDSLLRIYGCGELNFAAINCEFDLGGILLAEDALGGLFIALPEGTVGYFAPDTLTTEDMQMDYDSFLEWALNGDTAGFYSTLLWEGWQTQLEQLSLNDGLACDPALWEKSEERTRKPEAMSELILRQLGEFTKRMTVQ